MQKYPFRSTALAKQTVIESDPKPYPFREKSTTQKTTPQPRLIEDSEDAMERTLAIFLLGAIIVSLLLLVELMYPGWSVLGLVEVSHG